MTTTTRGECPTCRQDRALTTKGVMRWHEVSVPGSRWGQRCGGSGKKPARLIDPDAAVKAAAFREAAQIADEVGEQLHNERGPEAASYAWLVRYRLRARADELLPAGESPVDQSADVCGRALGDGERCARPAGHIEAYCRNARETRYALRDGADELLPAGGAGDAEGA